MLNLSGSELEDYSLDALPSSTRNLEELDLSNVPARGRWGTPTAQAFPISLKSAFKAAIAKSQKKNPR